MINPEAIPQPVPPTMYKDIKSETIKRIELY